MSEVTFLFTLFILITFCLFVTWISYKVHLNHLELLWLMLKEEAMMQQMASSPKEDPQQGPALPKEDNNENNQEDLPCG